MFVVFFFKQKTAYEMRISDWSSDVCSSDLKVVGDTDGAAGYDPQRRFADHVKSCAKSGAAPDQTGWYEGYRSGITRYCTPLSGASNGEAGRGYHNVCSPELEPAFMRGYGLGKRVHDQIGRAHV